MYVPSGIMLHFRSACKFSLAIVCIMNSNSEILSAIQIAIFIKTEQKTGNRSEILR